MFAVRMSTRCLTKLVTCLYLTIIKDTSAINKILYNYKYYIQYLEHLNLLQYKWFPFELRGRFSFQVTVYSYYLLVYSFHFYPWCLWNIWNSSFDPFVSNLYSQYLDYSKLSLVSTSNIRNCPSNGQMLRSTRMYPIVSIKDFVFFICEWVNHRISVMHIVDLNQFA